MPRTLRLVGFQSGIAGQEVSIVNKGLGQVTISHNGAGTQKILLPGAGDASLPVNGSASFLYDGSHWLCVGLNN